MHGNDSLRQTAVQARVPCDVRTESRRDAVRDNLKHAAYGVASAIGVVDYFLHPGFSLGVDAAEQNVFLLAQRDQFLPRRGPIQPRLTNTDHVAQDANAKLSQKCFGQSAHRNARRGLSRAGAFQNVAGIREIVLQAARQVGVARTRTRHRFMLSPAGRRLLLEASRSNFSSPCFGSRSRSATRWSWSIERRRQFVRDPFRSSCGRRARTPVGGAIAHD